MRYLALAVMLVSACGLPEPMVPTETEFTQLSVKGDQSCGLDRRGIIFCWGAGSDSGAGTLPHPVDFGPTRFRGFVATGNGGCGLLLGGGTACWADRRSALVRVTGAPEFVRLVAGDQVCGETSDSAIWCWSKIGGAATQVTAPGVLHGLAAGTFACGIDSGSHAECWGSPYSKVPTLVMDTITFSKVLPMYGRMCGVASSGTILCWSISPAGGTGPVKAVPTAFILDGTTWVQADGSSGWLVLISNGGRGYELAAGSTVPNSEGRAVHWQSQVGGAAHACGYLDDGRAACWGSNSVGQLGNGTMTSGSDAVLIGGGTP